MLASETLIYTNFTDPRTKNRPGFVGSSGPLLMAEDTCGKKYIVKYQFPHVTANEYTASWIIFKYTLPGMFPMLVTTGEHSI